MASDDVGFVEQVRRVIGAQLMHQLVSVNSISMLFGLPSRTLSRRLKLEGAPFNELSNQVRSGIADELIAESEIQLSQIADALALTCH
jgi:AraC-like DNA-binding protein